MNVFVTLASSTFAENFKSSIVQIQRELKTCHLALHDFFQKIDEWGKIVLCKQALGRPHLLLRCCTCMCWGTRLTNEQSKLCSLGDPVVLVLSSAVHYQWECTASHSRSSNFWKRLDVMVFKKTELPAQWNLQNLGRLPFWAVCFRLLISGCIPLLKSKSIE